MASYLRRFATSASAGKNLYFILTAPSSRPQCSTTLLRLYSLGQMYSWVFLQNQLLFFFFERNPIHALL